MRKHKPETLIQGRPAWLRPRVIFVVLFCLVGVSLVLYIKAATSIVILEAENAQPRTGGAIAGTDAAASNGSYLQFGPGGTSTPPPTGTCTGNPAGTFARSAHPCDQTTGPEVAGLNEDALPASGHSGNWVITTAGTTVSGVRHSGTIEVRADNVVIKNSVITASAPLMIQNFGQNLTVENTILRGFEGGYSGKQGQGCEAGIGYGNYTLRRVEISGCADMGKMGGVVAIYDSYMHDGARVCEGPSDDPCTHNDGFQKDDNTSMTKLTYEGNASYMRPCLNNRHFQIKNIRGVAISIKNNFFYGAHGVVNGDGTAGGNSGTVSGNRWAGTASRGPFTAPTGVISPGLMTGGWNGGVTITGNAWENGDTTNANRTGGGWAYTCVSG